MSSLVENPTTNMRHEHVCTGSLAQASAGLRVSAHSRALKGLTTHLLSRRGVRRVGEPPPREVRAALIEHGRERGLARGQLRGRGAWWRRWHRFADSVSIRAYNPIISGNLQTDGSPAIAGSGVGRIFRSPVCAEPHISESRQRQNTRLTFQISLRLCRYGPESSFFESGDGSVR